MNWNVDGLLSKLCDSEFVGFLSSFSVICLTETHLVYFDNDNFLPDYECFVSPAQKLSVHGRYSGGTMCFISRAISDYFSIIQSFYDNILIFKIDKRLFRTACDIFLLVVYTPPLGSPFYENRDTTNGIHLVENCLEELEEKYGDSYLILCGDFNARTGSLNACSDNFLPNLRREVYSSERSSGDRAINTFGRIFLSLCLTYGLRIVNGISESHSDKFTFISENGSSVIDYFVFSDDLLHVCKSLIIGEKTCSPHLPMEVDLICHVNVAVGADPITVDKIVWDRGMEVKYIGNLRTAINATNIDEALSRQDVHMSVETLSNCMTSAASLMRKSSKQSTGRKGFSWFDYECHEFKKIVRKKLRKFQTTRDRDYRIAYTRSRNEYKMLLR